VRVASQMVDERQLYLVDAESSKENWVSEGSICRRWVEKVSGSPSSNRKIVRGGPWGGVWREGGVSLEREGKKSMVCEGDGGNKKVMNKGE
jgi:hypothetical protein